MDKLDFSIIRIAGVAVSHFARICGVSRVSAQLYVAGKVQPRGLYRDRVQHRLQLLHKAYGEGKLPLPPMPRDKKFEALVAALKD